MDFGIQGRVALVCGGSAGLGRASAESLAREGCRLAICARREDKLERVRNELSDQFEVEVLGIPADMSSSEDIERLADQVLGHYGEVDILVNNAGGPRPGKWGDLSTEDWEKAVQLTLFSAQHCTRQFLPGMLDKGWGRIINITSISVKQPIEGLMLSNSIRMAVIGWGKTLSQELAGSGVLVNNLCPGTYLTDRIHELLDEQVEREGITKEQAIADANARVPLGRLGRPEELGDVVAFLASERASFITGVSLQVDGGIYGGSI